MSSHLRVPIGKVQEAVTPEYVMHNTCDSRNMLTATSYDGISAVLTTLDIQEESKKKTNKIKPHKCNNTRTRAAEIDRAWKNASIANSHRVQERIESPIL